MKNNNYSYCGKIGIFGKTNVGKSSIFNKIIGNKISIISNKKGTTEKNILGIQTIQNYQLIYIDTPGMQFNKQFQYIKNNILKVKKYLSLILFIIEKTHWSTLDEEILNSITKNSIPIILVINKIDCITNKKIILPFIKKINLKHQFMEIVPVSAQTGENIDILINIIQKNIPKDTHQFLKQDQTNISNNFMITEIIREKFLNNLNQELPYLIKIKIKECFIDKNGVYNIYASIFVKNIRHKKIIIGSKGKKIKYCIFLAKKDIQKFLNTKEIILKLKVQQRSI
ncbi:GTPase Era [Buchnera aphidicola]|uniref:GTPase Era n=1 Tax=Buchnera aphidicola TaxID=9 RepID=UPI003463AEAD